MHAPRRGHARTIDLPGRGSVAALLLAGALLGSAVPVAAGGPVAVDLGRAAPFAILAGAGIAAAGRPHVIGDVGAYPRPAISNVLEAAVNGVVHHGGSVAELAQADLADAYVSAAGATSTHARHGSAIAGETLVAGVYAFTGDPASLRGRLTLDGQGDRDAIWIFQVPSDLVTAAHSTIELVGGAQACNAFWQVGGAATLGADSTFAGTVLASTAVTVEAGVTVDGRLLSTTGRVSLGSNTITLPVCAAAASNPALAGVVISSDTSIGSAQRPAPAVSRPDGPSSPLPIVVICALILAAILGEPRRGRRPAARASLPGGASRF